MVDRRGLDTFLVLLVFLATLLPYLEHLSQSVAYAVAVGILVLVSLLLLSLAKSNDISLIMKLLRNSLHFWALVFSLLISQYAIALSSNLSIWGLVKTAGYILVLTCAYFIIAPRALSLSKEIWSLVAALGGLLSLLGIVISVRGNLSFLGLTWSAKWPIPVIGYSQTASIFQDSNYFSVVALLGLMASLYMLALQKAVIPKLAALLLLFLNTVGVFLSYSRAGYLALGVAILAWLLLNAGITRQVLYISIFTALFVVAGTLLIHAVPTLGSFLQIEKGLSGRERLFPAAVGAIVERPLFGWGVGNVDDAIQQHVDRWTNATESFADYLILQGAANRWISSHNGLLDFFVMAGVPSGLLYCWLILVSVGRLYFTPYHSVERRFLLSTLVGMLLISQFTTHTVGGISFGSFGLTVLLGIANGWSLYHNLGRNWHVPV